MGVLRTTITIDDFIAARVRQLFHGNLSKGINELLHAHLSEKSEDERMYGALKGRISVKDVELIRREEMEAEKRDPLLRR